MDAGRFLSRRGRFGHGLTLACAGLTLGACAALRELGVAPAGAAAAAGSSTPVVQAPPAPPAPPPTPLVDRATMAPIPDPPPRVRAAVAEGAGAAVRPVRRRATSGVSVPADGSGRAAIAAANLQARETSRADAFVGGVQVFAYAPGRVYEVWTAPLRVTTLTLGAGESIVSKAAGDTVRWQIGETTSGQGPGQRAHVMIKPLERGLETNLVLATSQRVYLIQLRSGPPETFNAAVAWDVGAVLSPGAAARLGEAELAAPDPLVGPAGPLDARFRIEPKGRRPPWAPTAVMTDGVRTFLTFPPDAVHRESPTLLVVAPGGARQVVNYRQQAGLWVVDRVFDEAELRLGGKRPQTVRIRREREVGRASSGGQHD